MRNALDRQSLASLGAAAADNGAAAGRAHAFAKAVRPDTLDLARLIRPFHRNFLCGCTISMSVGPGVRARARRILFLYGLIHGSSSITRAGGRATG